jgi:putative aminopeptidase FrvX
VFSLEPAVAVAVDVTPSTDTPGGDPKETGERGLGSGPVLTRGSTANPAVFELLRDTAEAEGIPYEVEVTTDKTHTDMDAIHLSRIGVAASLVSVPTRYLHTPTEVCALEDVDACARLLAAFAQRLEPDVSFAR